MAHLALVFLPVKWDNKVCPGSLIALIAFFFFLHWGEVIDGGEDHLRKWIWSNV